MTVFLFEMSAMYALIVLFFRLGYQLIFLIGLAGNFQSKVLFEKKESEKLGETDLRSSRYALPSTVASFPPVHST